MVASQEELCPMELFFFNPEHGGGIMFLRNVGLTSNRLHGVVLILLFVTTGMKTSSRTVGRMWVCTFKHCTETEWGV
jgi:hypothetical protein